MSLRPNDPLLAAGKIMTVLLMALIGLVTALMLVLIPFILFNHADFAAAVAEAGIESVGMAKAASVSLLLIAATATAFAFYFFWLLYRIIKTVADGDPFTLENASRLTRMGWIALGFQIASFPIEALAIKAIDYLPADDISADISFSLTGVLLAIVLFILARIFRHGAAMRDDLEGTV
ncbi:DUF2975 domain-containing protein [uncultured Erythrobacter sp.]|uniref:DUF2975 domain-containing protein n=1 Tax=uncultured Erythrobacter sp. TaxID=263913 RepID=UPI0026388DFB|nr:DUF2975 domain-containing protein [uncultured Erythrobacter sp.]